MEYLQQYQIVSLLFSGAHTEREWALESDADPSSSSTTSLLPYEKLAFDVRLGAGKLSLAGTDSDTDAVLLTLQDGTQWQSKANLSHDPASLIRVLSLTEQANIPATESTRHLIRWLPLAQEAKSSLQATPPTAHLRGDLR